jgi:anti-sigma-K factor RskA
MNPIPVVWDQIERRLDATDGQVGRVDSFWNSLNFWRNLSMVTATLLLVMGISLFTVRQPELPMHSIMVMLNDQAKSASCGWRMSRVIFNHWVFCPMMVTQRCNYREH